MTKIPCLSLNDKTSIPQFGLGTWQVPNEQVPVAVAAAWESGYRAIDTAAIYQNETGVGEGLRRLAIPRDKIYITTKLWNADQGYDSTLKAMDTSLAKLGLDYVDLYLIHWPLPKRNRYLDTWKALIKLKESGKAKSIGVSNFTIPHLQRVINETGITPSVNQIELHPQLAQKEMRAFHAQHGIVTESWSPLAQGNLLTNETIVGIARKHNKTAAQVILRWHIENGLVVIPKSVNPARIKENIAIFDFQLTPEDMSAIDQLDTGKRFGSHPDVFDMV
ncbi:MAG: aldo/keto reductase [Puniceicoccales bacterium]|jgi:2,5-diketo-D-gluconate reductase A|nr:aldo/keto reductase [Puniceicoccales bacterium]